VVETIDRFATGDESPVHRRLSPAVLVLIVLATIFGLLILLPLVVELIDFLLENPF
jgi:hypothetical protein